MLLYSTSSLSKIKGASLQHFFFIEDEEKEKGCFFTSSLSKMKGASLQHFFFIEDEDKGEEALI